MREKQSTMRADSRPFDRAVPFISGGLLFLWPEVSDFAAGDSFFLQVAGASLALGSCLSIFIGFASPTQLGLTARITLESLTSEIKVVEQCLAELQRRLGELHLMIEAAQ